MQIQREDKRLIDSYEMNHLFKKGLKLKKVKVVAKPVTGTTPAAIIDKKTGKVLIKTTGKKKKKKKFFKKIGSGIKKGVKAVGKAVKKVTQVAVFAPLLPLKGMMKKALRKKGVSPPSKMPDLAEAFFNNIVKKSHFDSYYHGRTLERDGYNDHFITVEIVGGILKFVKDLLHKKKAKKAGLPVALSPVEEQITADSERVLTEIEKRASSSGVELDSEELTDEESAKDGGSKGGRKKNDEKEGLILGLPTTTVMIIGGVLVAVLVLRK